MQAWLPTAWWPSLQSSCSPSPTSTAARVIPRNIRQVVFMNIRIAKNTVGYFVHHDITLDLSFCNSFSFIRFPRCIHDGSCCSRLFVLIDIYCFMEGTHCDVLVPFPVVSVSGCFFVSVVKSAAMKSFYAHESEYVSKSGIPQLKSIFIFNLKSYWQSAIQSILCHFAILYFHQWLHSSPF